MIQIILAFSNELTNVLGERGTIIKLPKGSHHIQILFHYWDMRENYLGKQSICFIVFFVVSLLNIKIVFSFWRVFNLTIFILFTSPELYSKDDIPIIVSWNSWIWYTEDNPFNFASTYWHFAYTRYLFAEGPISEPVVLKVQLFGRFYLSSSNFFCWDLFGNQKEIYTSKMSF